MYMREKIVNVDGIETRYIETSGSSGIPLIILHGWGSSINSWTKIAQQLEGAEKKVFVPDLPGFGKTPEPPRPWSADDYAEFVKHFTQRLGIKKFFLAGHSFGGQIAIFFTLKYRDKLQGLILLSAARIVRRRKLKVKIFSIFTSIGNSVFSIPPLYFLKPLVQKMWYKLSGERDYYKASPLMKETFRLVIEQGVSEELSKIQIPTLILWGGRDNLTPLEDAWIIHRAVSGSKIIVFEDEEHDINLKIPLKVSQEIVKFI